LEERLAKWRQAGAVSVTNHREPERLAGFQRTGEQIFPQAPHEFGRARRGPARARRRSAAAGHRLLVGRICC
jgi:hypothetical protein